MFRVCSQYICRPSRQRPACRMDDERLFHLSDEQWAQIEGTFPQRRGTSGFERKISNRFGV